MPDIKNQKIEVGDRVVAAMREGNVAALREGVVIAQWWGPEPQVTRTPAVQAQDDEEVIRVQWEYSSRPYLPSVPTKISAKKTLRIPSV